MNTPRTYTITPFDVEYAARRANARPAKRSTATSDFRPHERSRGVERMVLGSVLLVFLAIAIPQYVNYRRMAADITTRGSIRQAVAALESYGETPRGYSGTDALALQRKGMRLGSNQWLLVVSVPNTYWVLAQTSASSGLWVRSSKDSRDHLIAAK